jgi:hypothetical protein
MGSAVVETKPAHIWPLYMHKRSNSPTLLTKHPYMVFGTRLFSTTQGKQHGESQARGNFGNSPIQAFPKSFPLFPKEKRIFKILYAPPHIWAICAAYSRI